MFVCEIWTFKNTTLFSRGYYNACLDNDHKILKVPDINNVQVSNNKQHEHLGSLFPNKELLSRLLHAYRIP